MSPGPWAVRAPRGRRWAPTALLALAFALALTCVGAGPAGAAHLRPGYRVVRACGAPLPGHAACLALRLVARPPGTSELRAGAARQALESAGGAVPEVQEKAPIPGFLDPQELHAAYSLPQEGGGATQTIGIVDAYDDPTAEADLGVYSKQYGLPACTAANGCFRKLNEEGRTSPLPPKSGGWAVEISLDVQMAHAICQSCRILLVEASSNAITDLGRAVNAAVSAGATEVSNSYAGPEGTEAETLNADYYEHPGVLIAAASGDCGYLNEACQGGEPGSPNFPADSPEVLAVGGTTLTGSGTSWSSTAWEDGGSGCSAVFASPPWQTAVGDFSATGCGGRRSSADVAAVGNPETGVEVYDSTPSGEGYPTGWWVWGGTSVASPIVTGEVALAGGPNGIAYPALTIYSHLGESQNLYDVVSGSNGTCGGSSSCQAGSGYDGPTGVGSPVGLGAFTTVGAPLNTSAPSISGTPEEGQTLSLTAGRWSGAASFAAQWEACNAEGGACTPIPGATASTYAVPSNDIGSSLRVREIAVNKAGNSEPADSTATAPVASGVPTLAAFAPASAITGSEVTITGTALNSVTAVHFGSSVAGFTVVSPTQIEAIVPNGARRAKISLISSFGTLISKAVFTPTLSITALSPKSGPAGRLVTVSGVGFNGSSSVSFGGDPSLSVTHVSSTKLRAVVPAGAGTGSLTVTNTAAPLGTVAAASSFTVT
jgi:IPT/TIG domain